MGNISPVILLAGAIILLLGIYVFVLLGYTSPYILILPGILILLYLMYQANNEQDKPD